jgi:hypothetical protein
MKSLNVVTTEKEGFFLYHGMLGMSLVSVPDWKLLITDPDPQNENHEFRNRIRILHLGPDPSVNYRW